MALQFDIFADSSTNVDSDSNYWSEAELSSGFLPNTLANSKVVNSVLRTYGKVLGALCRYSRYTTHVGPNTSIYGMFNLCKKAAICNYSNELSVVKALHVSNVWRNSERAYHIKDIISFCAIDSSLSSASASKQFRLRINDFDVIIIPLKVYKTFSSINSNISIVEIDIDYLSNASTDPIGQTALTKQAMLVKITINDTFMAGTNVETRLFCYPIPTNTSTMTISIRLDAPASYDEGYSDHGWDALLAGGTETYAWRRSFLETDDANAELSYVQESSTT